MKKMNFYSNCCRTLFAVVMMLMTINVNAQLSCVGGSPTSPGANYSFNCNTLPTVNDVVVTQQVCSGTVTITSLGGTAITTALQLQDYIGKVVKVTASNVTTAGPDGICTDIAATLLVNEAADNVLLAGSCWGYLLIEDKTAPTITCPANITLDCTQVGSVNNLDITGEFNGAQNAQGPTGPTGTVVDCSKYTQSYTDNVTINVDCPAANSNVIRSITRTWTVKDVWGNTSATCTQTITVIRDPRNPALFDAIDIAGSCTVTDYSPTALTAAGLPGWPYYDANNNGIKDANEPFIIIGASPICNVQNTGFTDQVLPLCNGGRKIIPYLDNRRYVPIWCCYDYSCCSNLDVHRYNTAFSFNNLAEL